MSEQSGDPAERETIVVHRGPADGSTREVIEEFRESHPDHRLRLIEVGAADGADAVNVGLAAARGTHVVFEEVGEPETVGGEDLAQAIRLLQVIDAIDRSDPMMAAGAAGLITTVGEQINAYLQKNPDQRTTLIALVDRSGLREFPWATVNTGLARDLAVCYCFPPDLDTSGMVSAKRLRARGLVTDVISHDMSTLRSADPGSAQIAAQVVGRTRVVEGVPSFTDWTAMTPFVEECWATLAAWEEAQGSYRSLYSRAMPPNSHLAAALVKIRRPDLEWVAELSDPLRINPLGEERVGEVVDDWLSDELRNGLRDAGFVTGDERSLYDLAERLPYALADRLVFTNPAQMEMMLDYCEDPHLVDRARSIAEVSSHPVLPERYYELSPARIDLESGVVHLAYFGVFYSTRDLGDLVQALIRLRQPERERVRLHVFTNRPDRLTLDLTGAGLAGVVRARRFVPMLEFLNLTRQFDVLVVNDADTAEHHAANPYLPSKVADYRGSGTPIWAICEPGSVMSSMEFEHRSRLGDVNEAMEVLQGLISRRVERM